MSADRADEPGLTSIIIPTYQHAGMLATAIESAVNQSAPVEVIVIDDGSTDDTSRILQRYVDRHHGRVRVIRQDHAGPSVARNAGIDAARGEFLMFLDADDVLESTKITEQFWEFRTCPDAGWVLCDVRIEDERRRVTQNASDRYRYGDMELSGWIGPLLASANFIPIMSPLIRRSVLSDIIRFDDSRVPEDWHFWCAVANVARVRYVPKVLATYRKSRRGRSSLPPASRAVRNNITAPLRLNLGCGRPNTRSWHPMDGMVNLDKSLGWRFEDGLGEFSDASVSGITISHALMYLPEEKWPGFFSECARVLVEGGVVRITEDETQDPASQRLGGWKGSEPAITMTSPAFVKDHLQKAGLMPLDVDKSTTTYRDASLRQAQHGDPPDVFFVEGIRLAGVLFAPHSDDETLFAAFTILRYRPRVVVCFPSAGDYGDTSVREIESREALSVLGSGPFEQWQGGDLIAQMRAFDARVQPVRVWAPDLQTSHPDHVAVAEAARTVFGDRVVTFHTYSDGEKVRSDREVACEPVWVQHKLRALARYDSQLRHPRAHQFFLNDLREYYGEGTLP